MEAVRGSTALGIYGTNSTGKTVISELIAIRFNEKRDRLLKEKDYPKNYLKLVTFDPQDRFEKYRRKGDINIRIGDEGWEEKILSLRDSLCIFDDFKLLLDEDRTDKKILNIFGWRAEYGLDLVFITWHPNLTPPRIAKFIDKYYLFKISSDDKEYVKRINGDRKLILECKEELDREFSKYTEVEYKNLYPNFPFIYYDSGTNKAQKVNFKKIENN